MMANMSEDDEDNRELSDISNPDDDDDDDDKYYPTFSLTDKAESGRMEDQWNFPTTASGVKLDSKETADTLDGDKANVNVDTVDKSNQERRRNNRLQCGATKDKFSNAHRFHGGHEKANADRPKPSAVDQNISTGNNYSRHNSGPQGENHRHVDRNSQERHGSPHRSFVHTLDGDKANVNVDTMDKSNQERRRNNRLQSGATKDKFSNAHRFHGGHEKANADRPKPSAVDQNISTGNNYSRHNSGPQGENHRHVDRNSQERHGSPHRSCVHTLDGDKANVNVDTMDKSNQERRRNNRLQSGATKDKFSNAHRFHGGHEKANADRPKPSAVDQNISTGNNYSRHNSGPQGENHRHVDRNSQERHGSPHRSCVHTLDGDKANVNVDTMDKSNQERRRNNRLQSGATKDKFSNAHRFHGGHEKANADRPKPSAVDQNISTGNNYSRHNSGPQGENHRHVDRNSQERHGSSHRSFVHKETEDFVFFWREGSPFSQWHPAKFKVDDLEFNCAEQYIMYSKAKTAKNDAIAAMIMDERDPRAQKGYGRQIPGFDAEMWETQREEVVKRGNIAKFSQNPDLKEKLFETYPRTLVEASPVDPIWGIGLSAYDKEAHTKETWKGLNLLGKILTEVRDEFLKEVGFL